jgi:hypothetical protein
MFLLYSIIATVLMLLIVKVVSNGKFEMIENNVSHFKAKKRLSRNLRQILNIPVFILGIIFIVNQKEVHLLNSIIILFVIMLLVISGKKHDRQ